MEEHPQCTQITAPAILSMEGSIIINTQVSDGKIDPSFTNSHTLPGLPEHRPKPLWTVPFPPDPDFVSREALLEQIDEKVSIPGSRIALVGLGGVGSDQPTLGAFRQY